MRVTSLSYRNFKGHTGSWPLKPVTLITGANFSHKTSIPLALRLGLAGRLPPPIGTRGIFALAGNPTGEGSMEIQLTLDDSRVIDWKWSRGADGKVSTEGGLSSDVVMPELLLDPKTFFAKTAKEQVQIIFSACEVDDFGPDTIVNQLGKIQVQPLVVCEEVVSDIVNRIKANPVANVPEWVADLIEHLQIKAKQARDDEKSASGAFAAFRTDAAAAPAKDVSQALLKARAQFDALSKAANVAGDTLERLHAARPAKTVESELATATDALKECPDPETIEEELGDLEPIIALRRKWIASFDLEMRSAEEQLAKLETLEACPTCYQNKKGWKAAAMENLTKAKAKAQSQKASNESVLKEKLAQKEALQTWNKRIAIQQELTRELAEIQRLETAAKSIAADGGQVAKLQEEIRALEAQQRTWDVYQNDRGRKLALEAKLVKAGATMEVYKQAVAIVLQEQNKLIGKAFTQVLNVARHFTDGLLNSPLEFVNGSLGRRVSAKDQEEGNKAPLGAWVGFETFSGTEELLALAGFSVALTASAPVKIVVLDELARLDLERRLSVAQRMLSLAESGVIDQAVLIDVDARPYAGLRNRPGFTVIAL